MLLYFHRKNEINKIASQVFFKAFREAFLITDILQNSFQSSI